MVFLRPVAFLALLAACAAAREDPAAKLEARAIDLGRSAEESWKRFVLERAEFTDEDVTGLIGVYEEVVDLFHQSLEIEESPWPELEETKAERRRGIQSLRNFLMHYYFANRKFSALITRCTKCDGQRKIYTGRDRRTRQFLFEDCPQCGGTGARLQETAVRKAFWLTKSPLHRARPENQTAFGRKLARWKEHPAEVGEFLKGLSIGKIDYHGLWAVVKFKERGYAVATNRKFSRTVQAMFVRAGKRWFFFDEATDRDFFSPDAE